MKRIYNYAKNNYTDRLTAEDDKLIKKIII